MNGVRSITCQRKSLRRLGTVGRWHVASPFACAGQLKGPNRAVAGELDAASNTLTGGQKLLTKLIGINS